MAAGAAPAPGATTRTHSSSERSGSPDLIPGTPHPAPCTPHLARRASHFAPRRLFCGRTPVRKPSPFVVVTGRSPMKARFPGYLAVALVAILTSSALAQESKSAGVAKQLVAALEAAKLDTIATKDPSAPDVYIGALFIPGFELLV